MNTFEVFVRPVGANVEVPPLFSNAVAGSPITQAFDIGAGGLIGLQIDRSLLTQPYVSASMGDQVSSYWLHKAARATLSNPLTGKVHRIALLLANEYTYSPALGVMFDRGFATADDPANVVDDLQIVGASREACAVFLSAIEDLRIEAPAMHFDHEVLFNCVHELGHVFNLQHWSNEPNFLSQSPSKGGLPQKYKEKYHRFVEAHSNLLRLEPMPATIWPGGSNFADKGLHADKDIARARRGAERRFGLDIRIGLQRHSIAYFDPIELDVELRVLPGLSQRFRVLDQVDPGYESFRIWIEKPDGERHLYRCPRHYCRPQRTLTITPNRSFRRDISIFGQSGGYTFRQAGVHRLWVEFDPGSRPLLHSNVVELEIVATGKLDRAAQDCRPLFTSWGGRVLLYHRIDDTGGRATRKFLSVGEQFPRSSLAAEALYAVARAQVGAISSKITHEEREARVNDTLPMLKHLVDGKMLSDHKRKTCDTLLQSIRCSRQNS